MVTTIFQLSIAVKSAGNTAIWRHVDLPTVRTRITMQWMKEHKVDYEQYYIDSMSEIQVKLMFDLTTYVNN